MPLHFCCFGANKERTKGAVFVTYDPPTSCRVQREELVHHQTSPNPHRTHTSHIKWQPLLLCGTGLRAMMSDPNTRKQQQQQDKTSTISN